MRRILIAFALLVAAGTPLAAQAPDTTTGIPDRRASYVQGAIRGTLTYQDSALAALSRGDTARAGAMIRQARGRVRATETHVLVLRSLLADLPGVPVIRDSVVVPDTVPMPSPVLDSIITAPVEPDPLEPAPPVVMEPEPAPPLPAPAGARVVFPSAEVEAIIGPQLVAGSQANPWPWFDINSITHSLKLWNSPGHIDALERSHGYYYDRALVDYTNYYRTGDRAFLGQARAAADHWYDWSVADRAKFGGYSPREMALSGLILRALDGRPEMWDYILAHGAAQYQMWLGARLAYPELYFGVRDGGYMLLFAAQIAQTHPDPAVRAQWRQKAVDAAVKYYVRLQAPDGGWYWKDNTSETKPGGVWEQPFMVGLLLEGMIEVHQMTADPAVGAAILKSVDHLWSGYRKDALVPEAAGRGAAWRHVPYFMFTDGTYSGEEHLAGATAVREGWDTNTIREGRQRNSLVVHAFGYAYQLTKDAKYRVQGDEIFSATYGNGQGPGADAFYGLADFRGKEYNQAYRSAGRYLAWRAD